MNSGIESNRRTEWWRRILRAAVVVVALALISYQMITAQDWLMVDSFVHQNIHLGLALLIIFLPAMGSARSLGSRVSAALFLVLGVAGVVYVGLNLEHLQMVVGFPEPLDVAVGITLMLVVLEGTRRAWGLTLPIVATVFIAYFLFGHHLTGALHHRDFDIDYVVSYLSIGLTGIYGTFLSISANQIFLFVVFGALFRIMGIEGFLTEAGKLVGRRVRSGPGQTAVVSSSLVSMITGASVANVAVTGAFTIPYMKRAGYSRELAGAIEATASTGGQLMPPVMGAAAFLMAFFIGIPYAEVMLLGILPAALFYLGVMVSVHFASVAEGIYAPTEKPDYRVILTRAPIFCLPLAVIVTLLLMKYSPDFAAFWAIVTAIVMSQLRADRPKLTEVATSLTEGAIVGAKIAICLALVGIIAQTLITTGLGAKLAGLVEMLSAGNLLIALPITMLVSIVLGAGVPPAAAYSLVAMTAAPVLVKMGLPPISAHFFVFYFAIMSAVTPPVALGALAATALSGGNYMRTSMKGFALAISGFIVPYFFVFNPLLRLEIYRWDWALGAALAMPIALITLSATIYGHALRRLTAFERLLALVAAFTAFGYTVLRQSEALSLEYPMLFVSVMSFAVLCAKQFRKQAAGGASTPVTICQP